MTYTTYTTKKFIADFNFPDPDWDNLPPNFPNLPKENLTHEEEHLLGGIKLAWYATAGGFKDGARKSARIGLISLIGLIGLIGLINFIIQPSGNKFTRTVNAASLQVNEAIESTMSAILRR